MRSHDLTLRAIRDCGVLLYMDVHVFMHVEQQQLHMPEGRHFGVGGGEGWGYVGSI